MIYLIKTPHLRLHPQPPPPPLTGGLFNSQYFWIHRRMPPLLLFTSISPRFPLLASTRKPIHLPMKDQTHTSYGAVYFPPHPRLRSVIVSPNFNSSSASNATDSRCDAFKIREMELQVAANILLIHPVGNQLNITCSSNGKSGMYIVPNGTRRASHGSLRGPQSNDIWVQIPPKLIPLFKDKVVEQKLYKFQNFRVLMTPSEYRPISNKLIIEFTASTSVEEVGDLSDIPKYMFNFIEEKDIQYRVEQRVDLFDTIGHLVNERNLEGCVVRNRTSDLKTVYLRLKELVPL
ncbi:hypothetical protein LINPERHAP2_LOCUS39390 [Linum perenne]